MSDITVIGLGAMGAALAGTLIDRGLNVTVWNRSPEKAAPLAARGARHAKSATEAVEVSPVILISVLDYPAVRNVLEPAADKLNGRTLVNVTNGTPAQARKTAAWVEKHGAGYIDGAVMVTPEMVGGPEAFLFFSGSKAAYRRHEKTLKLLGSPNYLGENVALAPIYDLALLAAMFGLFGGYLHAAALLRSEEIPISGATPMIMSLLKAMTELFPQTAREIDTGEYPRPTSNNKMMAVALKNILDSSREQGVREDLMTPVWALFERAANDGLGDRDISALAPLLAASDGKRITQ